MKIGNINIIRRRNTNNQPPNILVNKPVISIPDNWSDIIIGVCTQCTDDGFYIIRDFVSGTDVEVNYLTYIFTEQRFQMALKNDRFDLCSFLYPDEFMDSEFRKEKEMYLLKPHEINNRLKANGFWEILMEYRQKSQTQV